MILVDTSVWVDHLHRTDSRLVQALGAGEVMAHPFVIGELACGNLRNRAEILRLLAALPSAPVASHAEAMAFIERRRLAARGIGFVDVHLLASVLLAGNSMLWTRDRRLDGIARSFGIAFTISG